MSDMADCQHPRKPLVYPVGRSTDSLADILERVLDKGIVIAGDIVVNIVDIELLTLKVRLLVSSVETARDLGIDWWSSDPFLSNSGCDELARQNKELRSRLEHLEQAVKAVGQLTSADPDDRAGERRAGTPADTGGPETGSGTPSRRERR